MNDPHVVALFYNVKHSASVDYSKAEPLEHEEDNFSVRIENKEVCFTMKAHYATKEEAREAVREYIDNWEFTAGLRRGPSVFKLVYGKAEIEDRRPSPAPPGVLSGCVELTGGLSGGIVATGRVTEPYPPPPAPGLTISPDVQSMYDRFMGYRSGRDRLPSMAAFCLDVLQGSTGSKSPNKKVAEIYGIELAVIKKIARLSNNRGGPDARKRIGINSPLTPKETCFLEEAVKAMILQMAAHAYDPDNMPPHDQADRLAQVLRLN